MSKNDQLLGRKLNRERIENRQQEFSVIVSKCNEVRNSMRLFNEPEVLEKLSERDLAQILQTMNPTCVVTKTLLKKLNNKKMKCLS